MIWNIIINRVNNYNVICKSYDNPIFPVGFTRENDYQSVKKLFIFSYLLPIDVCQFSKKTYIVVFVTFRRHWNWKLSHTWDCYIIVKHLYDNLAVSNVITLVEFEPSIFVTGKTLQHYKRRKHTTLFDLWWWRVFFVHFCLRNIPLVVL